MSAPLSGDALLRDLADPHRYPDSPRSVTIVQTHISVVCIADRHVYKLRKAVRLPFLDFSTASAREADCRAELRLNRRLCPDVYLDVVPLFVNEEGFSFRGPGTVIDHAVRMRRLPQERMLDECLARGETPAEELRRIAATLAAFHAEQIIRPSQGEPGHPDELARFVLANFSETESLRGGLFEAELHRALEARARDELRTLLPLLRERIAQGRVVDGHGDLHSRNICLTTPPAIYDCLEFSPRLRCGDVATDNAFLAMDLHHRGRRELARLFAETYAELAGDEDQLRLLPPLMSYRAMVRAKVNALSGSDPLIPEPERARARSSARDHLRLAARLSIESGPPLLLLACGLPGSGKSWLLERLAEATGWPLHASDRIRKELLGLPLDAAAPPEAYTDARRERAYEILFARAEEELRRGHRPVLLDATFSRSDLRRRAHALARVFGGRGLTLFIRAEDDLLRERLAERARRGDSASDADEAVARRLQTTFEEPDGTEPFLAIDSSLDVERLLDRIFSRLLA